MKKLHAYEREIFDLNYIENLADTNINKLIEEGEEFYHHQIFNLCKKIVEKEGKIKLIMLGGPSSSGKTTSSMLIRENLAEFGYECIVVSLDDFYKNRNECPRHEDGTYDFECIESLDLDIFKNFIEDLFKNKIGSMPLFDFTTGKRKEKPATIEMNDNTIIIIEGLHALNPNLIVGHDSNIYKVYICINTDFVKADNEKIPAQKVRLMRRLIRDYYFRNTSFESTMELWHKVLEGEELYIKPFKNTADFLVNSTHMFEPLLMAKYLLPLLIKEKSPNPILEELKSYLIGITPLDKKYIPSDSLMNEFI